LFSGIDFVFAGQFTKPSKDELIQLLECTGAGVSPKAQRGTKIAYLIREAISKEDSATNTITLKHLLDLISTLSPLTVK
jgi:hypothetical protein